MRIEIAFTPKQTECDKALDRHSIVFYGGAKGGGKSYAMRNILFKRRLLYPGTTGAIFRRTYEELKDNHIKPLLTQFPVLNDWYHHGDKELRIPNGSRLKFRYCFKEDDVLKYQGQEFDDLGIEECGQWTEAMFKRLLGSNRTSKVGVKPRCLLTGNPGGLGHKWLKRIFVQKDLKPEERGQDYAFIQALVDDNPALLNADPDYVRRLESEPNEMLRKAYRYGSWDIFAGQFFHEVDRSVHMVEPFPIPDHWNRFYALDYGFNHPAAFVAFAVDEDGNVYQTHEIVVAQHRPDQLAEKIKSLGLSIPYVFAGHDCWNKVAGGMSTAEQFAQHGVMLRKANIDRIQGWRQLRAFLAHTPERPPRFKMFSTCQITFDCLTRLVHNPNNVEDVLKVDAVEGDPWTGDDAGDSLRYGLMSRPLASAALQKRWKTGYDFDSGGSSDGSWQTV